MADKLTWRGLVRHERKHFSENAIVGNMGSCYLRGDPKPRHWLAISDGKNEIFRFDFDEKTVKLGDLSSWDDAAKTFWKYVLSHAPNGTKVL